MCQFDQDRLLALSFCVTAQFNAVHPLENSAPFWPTGQPQSVGKCFPMFLRRTRRVADYGNNVLN